MIGLIAKLLGGFLAGIVAKLATAWALFQAGASSQRSADRREAHDVSKKQLDVSARPNSRPDRILDRMRDGGL